MATSVRLRRFIALALFVGGLSVAGFYFRHAIGPFIKEITSSREHPDRARVHQPEGPKQPASRVAQLPEFYGFYALDNGRLVELNKQAQLQEVSFGPDVQFILFDKDITKYSGDGAIALGELPFVRYQLIGWSKEYHLARGDLEKLKTGSVAKSIDIGFIKQEAPYAPEIVAVKDWFSTSTPTSRVKVRSKPVSGRTEMIQIVPADELPPGVYQFAQVGSRFAVRYDTVLSELEKRKRKTFDAYVFTDGFRDLGGITVTGFEFEPTSLFDGIRTRWQRRDEEKKRIADAKRKREEQFSVSGLKYAISGNTVVLTFDVEGGKPPFRHGAGTNDRLFKTLARYQTVEPWVAGINKHPFYTIDARPIAQDEAGKGKGTVVISAPRQWAFSWPPQESFPIKVQVDVSDSADPPKTRSVETEIKDGPHEFVEAADHNARDWIEHDGEPLTKLSMAGTWIVEATRDADALRRDPALEFEMRLQQHGSRLSGNFSEKSKKGAIEGVLKGRVIEFSKKYDDPPDYVVDYVGLVEKSESAANGDWRLHGPKFGMGKWSMRRAAKPDPSQNK